MKKAEGSSFYVSRLQSYRGRYSTVPYCTVPRVDLLEYNSTRTENILRFTAAIVKLSSFRPNRDDSFKNTVEEELRGG